jgi:stage V sporulation protein B
LSGETSGTKELTITRGTYDLFLGNLISTLILALTSIIVGRLLAPSGFGLYTIALIVPSYVYLLLQFGVSSTITRYSAKYLSEGNEKKATSFSYTISLIHLAIGILVIGVLFPFTQIISTDLLHRPELSTGLIIPIALLSVLGQLLFYNASGAFAGLHRFDKNAIFQIINASAKLVLSISLVLAGYEAFGAIVGFTFSYIIAGAIALFLFGFMNKSFFPADIRESVKTTLKYSPPIYISAILVSVISPIQTTILAYVVSNTQIGWYAAAVNIGTLISLFTYPVTTAAFPLFSRTTFGGTNQLSEIFKLSVKYAALFIVPVTCIVMVLAVPLATAIYGRAYQFAGNYFLPLATVNLLAGAGSLSDTQFLYGIGETRKALLATAIGAAVSIALSAVLAFYVGVFGIIIGTVLGQAVSLCFNLRYISNILKVNPRTWFFSRIYISSAISALIVYPLSLLNLNPYLTVVVGAAIFLLILIPVMSLTKALPKGDFRALQDQFNEVRPMKLLLEIIGRYRNIFP